MPIKNYTTKVSVDKTLMEIQKNLSKHGAKKVVLDYKNGMPAALTFSIVVNQNAYYFALPSKFKAVLKVIENDPKIPKSFKTEKQALKVSWRILKDWIDAQMAMVEAELASLSEVFLPYAITKKDGKTLYELS